ncbi:MAG: hypothetical protein KA767_03080 [Saprospiraceae bacterium]|nr:hypothetical protein [Saprospiraceae bacterium]
MSRILIASFFLLLSSINGFSQTKIYATSFQGPNGLSDLYTLDMTTGLPSLIGPIGFERCGSMEIDPLTGIAYAACERTGGSNTPVLVRVNLTTGAGTEIGPTGTSGAVTDLAFSPSGQLFLYDGTNSPSHSLWTVNTSTGVATLIAYSNIRFTGGNGITFVGNSLYHSSQDSCNVVDQTTAQGTSTGVLSGFGLDGGRVNSMDTNPGTGEVYALVNFGSSGSGPTALVVLDPSNCMISDTINTNLSGLLDGITVISASRIPTLNEWGMLILFLIMMTVFVQVFKSANSVKVEKSKG